VPRKGLDERPPDQIPEEERDYFLERKYPAFGNLAPRDIASRSVKEVCDQGRGVGPGGRGVYLDLRDAVQRLGKPAIQDLYGNLFDIYRQITAENAYETPFRIYPAPHYTMGGLWVDYHLMSTIPGLFVIGEANFSDHGANRLGASALMQGLADGYFIVPCTLGDYLASTRLATVSTDHPEFRGSEEGVRKETERLLALKGGRTVTSYHLELGNVLWEHCGMARNEAGLKRALERIPALREEFLGNIIIPGSADELNMELEKAGRVRDFLGLGELMCRDALARNESCGAHFREEYQTRDGETLRDDQNYCHVSVWEHAGEGNEPVLHKEPLVFETVKPSVRSYK
jgi:succinate dehydrogenase / fumarate reductase flavoprotein subunit